MGKLVRFWAFLLPILAALTAYSGSSSQPAAGVSGKSAHFVYIVDISNSPATMNDSTVTRAAEDRIGEDEARRPVRGPIQRI